MEKNRFEEITLMNTFLCFSVVMIHLTSAPVETLTHGSFWHIMMFIINKALCFSVPAFIFLSGFKLYNKYDGIKIDLKKFYVGRVKKIVIPYIICVLIHFIYFLSKGWAGVSELPQYMFLGTLAAHFYYIIIAVQLYLVFPVLNVMFKKYPGLITVVSLVCTICCHEFWHFNYSDRFIGTYVFYFILGMLFAKYRLYRKISKIQIISFVGFIVTAVIHLTFSYMAISGKLIYRYAEMVNIMYVIFSIMLIYGICIKLIGKYKVIDKCSHFVSGVSYNIYLYHILVIFILQYDVFPHIALSAKSQFVMSFAVVYSLIFIYSFLAGRIKNVSH